MDYRQAAANYLALGFSVLPIRTDGTKSPAVIWKPYQERVATDDELTDWFGNGHPCGIAVVAGKISGNLLVLDFDHEAEQFFGKWWTMAATRLPGIETKMAVISTPRPGRQVWFRQQSEPEGNQVLAYTKPQPTGEVDADGALILHPAVIIETRVAGGYAVAVGSAPSVHSTGRSYELISGSFNNLPPLPDSEVATLLDVCRSFNAYEPTHVQSPPAPSYSGEPRPGDIYNQRADIREILGQHGWRLHHTEPDGSELWTRPGKELADGWSASLGHLMTDDRRQLFYCFSSQAVPFRANECYDAFAVFAHLEHSGDFASAAAAARQIYEPEVSAAQAAYHLDTVPPYKPFPVHLLPGIVQDYVAQHAGSIGVDAAFVAVPMLPVLGGLIGQTRRLHIKQNWSEPAALWAATIADVSTGKTPGWQSAIAPARDIERRLNDTRKTLLEQYEQQLAEYQERKAAGESGLTKPQRPNFDTQLTIDDCTMETLLDIHQKNWRGLLLTIDELAGWLRSFDLYRGGKGRDVENWLSIYTGGPAQVNRKTDDYRVYLHSTAVSVCGTIQPGVAAGTLFTDRFIENGFTSRILSVRPPAATVRWSDLEVTETVDAEMFQLANALFDLQGEDDRRSVYLPFEEPARRLYRAFTDEAADHADAIGGPLRSAWLKLRPVAARFALMLSVVKQLLEYPEGQAMRPVDIDSTQAGIELAWWFGNETVRNYETFRRDTSDCLDDHLAWIREKYPKGITARDLQMGRRGARPTDKARQILVKLAEDGYGTWDGKKFFPN